MRVNNVLKVTLLFLFAIVLAAPADAQGRRGGGKKKTRTERTKRPDQSSEFLDRLWVGGNLADLAFFNNTFVFGLTPVAAYEINDFLMVGPFVRMAYRYERYDIGNNERISYSTFDVGPGIFVRGQIFREVFLQFDYESAFLEQAQVPLAIDGEGKILTENMQQNYVYLGLGYSSGSDRSKFTFSVHYNVLDDIEYVRIPWDVRIGVMFKIGKGSTQQELPSNR